MQTQKLTRFLSNMLCSAVRSLLPDDPEEYVYNITSEALIPSCMIRNYSTPASFAHMCHSHLRKEYCSDHTDIRTMEDPSEASKSSIGGSGIHSRKNRQRDVASPGECKELYLDGIQLLLSLCNHLLGLYNAGMFTDQVVICSVGAVEPSTDLITLYLHELVSLSASVGPDASTLVVSNWLEVVTTFPATLPHSKADVVAERLWGSLTSFSPQIHLRVSQLVTDFELLSAGAFSRLIGSSMASEDTSARVLAFERFAILWRMIEGPTPYMSSLCPSVFSSSLLTPETPVSAPSSPDLIPAVILPDSRGLGLPLMFQDALFCMLDAVEDASGPVRAVARLWLRDALQQPTAVLDPLCGLLAQGDTVKDQAPVLRSFRRLRIIIESEPEAFVVYTSAVEPSPAVQGHVACLIGRQLGTSGELDEQGDALKELENKVVGGRYLMLVCYLLVRLLPTQTDSSAIRDDSFALSAEAVTCLLGILRLAPHRTRSLSLHLGPIVLERLNICVKSRYWVLQTQLVQLMSVIMEHTDDSDESIFASDLFVSTLQLGICRSTWHGQQSSNTTTKLVSAWVGLAISCLSHLNSSLSKVLPRTIDTLIAQMRHIISDLRSLREQNILNPSVLSFCTSDISILLQGLRLIYHHCFQEKSGQNPVSEDLTSKVRLGTGLLGPNFAVCANVRPDKAKDLCGLSYIDALLVTCRCILI